MSFCLNVQHAVVPRALSCPLPLDLVSIFHLYATILRVVYNMRRMSSGMDSCVKHHADLENGHYLSSGLRYDHVHYVEYRRVQTPASSVLLCTLQLSRDSQHANKVLCALVLFCCAVNHFCPL